MKPEDAVDKILELDDSRVRFVILRGEAGKESDVYEGNRRMPIPGYLPAIQIFGLLPVYLKKSASGGRFSSAVSSTTSLMKLSKSRRTLSATISGWRR